MCCAADNHNYMRHIMCKRILRFEQIFTKSPQLLHSYKKKNRHLLSIIIDQLLLPYKFYSRDMLEMHIFIFASCERLNIIHVCFVSIF